MDIGDKVKKGDTLATLFVPELVEDFGTKKATVELDKQRIELAKKVVKVAEADVKAAKASLAEAKAILDKFEAEVERWDSEVKRLQTRGRPGRGRSPGPARVDQPVEVEHRRAGGGQGDHRARPRRTCSPDRPRSPRPRSTSRSPRPTWSVADERGEADRGVGGLPQAPRALRRRDRGPQCQHLRLRPARHGRSHGHGARSPPVAHGGAAPIYVVDRTDIVRIFVDIPEQDANYVHIGTKATVLAKAYRDQPIPGTVTRTSWALNVKSRTLRAEIDLPNPDSQLLPGMYAYAKVIIERPGVRALPLAALTHSGEKTYCWKHENGKAVRAEIQTGVSDGEWIEVTNLPAPAGGQRRGSLGAGQRLGTGDPGRPVDPRRGRPRGDRSGDGEDRGESRECDGLAGSGSTAMPAEYGLGPR